ncbi:MAG: type II toxin-antitoxin system RelE/ParE family toxin [Clostridia bacterium]|nr:type II toxin-antitoxin system RelE/ParE family toxin [Clostridia bacterium]
MPGRFRLYDKEPWRSRGLRIMPVDNYLVFYIPDTENETVSIIRIMYGGRDIDAQLRKHTKTE